MAAELELAVIDAVGSARLQAAIEELMKLKKDL